MKKAKPYYYVRFRWSKWIDMKEAAIEFSKKFSVETLSPPTGKDMTVFKGFREELKVTANNLKVLLSPQRAVLYQREPAPFTSRDMELRKLILELYPRARISFLPLFVREPLFEIAQEPHDPSEKRI